MGFVKLPVWAAFAVVLLAVAACRPAPGGGTPTSSPTAAPTTRPTPTALSTPTSTPTPTAGSESGSTIQQLKVEIIAAYDHDPAAFTQGLVFDSGMLYESTGQYGASTLREIDPQTGAVLQQVEVRDQFFAEGLALVNGELIQLTWREQTAFVYDLANFEEQRQYTYDGEGWGLCYDGDQLYMSDGSSTITRRDPQSFASLDTIQITMDNHPINRLNELECVDKFIYANVWHTDSILQIDKRTGRVVANVDAAGLLTPEQTQAAGREGVLNGIAYDPATDHFYITGKLWPLMFKVRFASANP